MSRKLLPPCPHCGEQAGLTVKSRLWGWETVIFDPLGRLELTLNDGMNNKLSRLIRCEECGKKREDVRFVVTELGQEVIVAREKAEDDGR